MKEEVKVGQKYIDNDIRMGSAQLVVVEILGDYALCLRNSRKVKILIRRLQNRGGRGYTLKGNPSRV